MCSGYRAGIHNFAERCSYGAVTATFVSPFVVVALTVGSVESGTVIFIGLKLTVLFIRRLETDSIEPISSTVGVHENSLLTGFAAVGILNWP